MDEQNPIKPKRRWFQFNLKTLLLLPVIAGLGTYWYDWSRHRPPYRRYDVDERSAAWSSFLEEIRNGELDQAYDSTSARFKRQMSRTQFHDLVRSHPALQQQSDNWLGNYNGPASRGSGLNALRTCYDFASDFRESDGTVIELWIWVVIDDSFFYLRPPPPRVEEILIREFAEADWRKKRFSPVMLPSWERQPSP